MSWALLILASLCFVVIFIHLGVLERVDGLNKILTKVVKTIRSADISDHWKEKVLPRYAFQLFKGSLSIAAVLFISFSPFIIFSLLSIFLDGEFIKTASSIKGIAISSFAAILFAMLLTRKSSENYGTGSKFLHQIALGSSFFGETLFDIERVLHGSKAPEVSAGNHVFVAGLARAGTTILMRRLYENGEFCSLTYKDMPFVLAPNTWRSITSVSQRKSEMQERAHGDGVLVDYDSPEALEEVFWRTFCGAAYIKPDSLVPMVADPETVEKFRSFVSIILKNRSASSYLSKNNNNILRLGSIAAAFPNGLIVIPFREPLQQAFSLRTQHLRFKDAEDRFTEKYMTWLAHHEFGADHRPFLFEKETDISGNTGDLSYWLHIWINTYSYLIKNLPSQAVLLSYECLCDDTEYVWGKLAERAKLIPYGETISFSKSINQVDEPIPQGLISQADELYDELMRKAIGYRDN